MSKIEYFSTDGICDKAIEDFINADFLKLGLAARKILGRNVSRKIIIGKDIRISEDM